MFILGLFMGIPAGVILGGYLCYRSFVHEMAWWDLDEEAIKEIEELGTLSDWNENPNLHIDRFTFLPEMFSAYHGKSFFQRIFVMIGFPAYGFLRIFQEAYARRFSPDLHQ